MAAKSADRICEFSTAVNPSDVSAETILCRLIIINKSDSEYEKFQMAVL